MPENEGVTALAPTSAPVPFREAAEGFSNDVLTSALGGDEMDESIERDALCTAIALSNA
jgi:hypothetical protein